MYQLFIANKNYSSWSLRPWVLMQTLSIPFAEHLMPFPQDGATHAFRTFSPSGKVPCLQDGNAVVWDSLAITEYLAERHAGVWPSDPQLRAWARCAAAEMHSGFGALRNECSMNCGIRVTLNAPTPALNNDLARLDELWNDGLNRFAGPFLAGAVFTAVDAFFAPVAFRIQTYHLQLSAAAHAYAKRLLALPAMQVWYAAALMEPWREHAHEQECKSHTTWLADLRVGTPG
jgi:glutathione S-transferase